MSEPTRPWCCPEPRCTPVHQLANQDSLGAPIPGDSFLCFGRMPQEIVFVYDGDEHRNDLRSCCYTPLKGVVANQENEDDWRLLSMAYSQAVQALADTPKEGTREGLGP